VAAYGAEGTHGRVDATGKEFFGAELQVAGASEGSGHVFKYRRGEREAVRAERECPHLRIEIWGTRLCGFNLDVGTAKVSGSGRRRSQVDSGRALIRDMSQIIRNKRISSFGR
jgi:hypothetical protein